ncbi:M28 family peptidase [Candidatus Woesearchaeota archaeon]|nr:M28 family peptidase [Candidatus Woesearchaeota archaeon]
MDLYTNLQELCSQEAHRRGVYIKRKLHEMGIEPCTQPFPGHGIVFENIFYEFNNTNDPLRTNRPHILFGAHYDRVHEGQGAHDNGAAVIELLGTVESLLTSPTPPKVHITFAFFDAEERQETTVDETSRLGSAYHARSSCRYDNVYNIDCAGQGEVVAAATGTVVERRNTEIWCLPHSQSLNNRALSVCAAQKIPYAIRLAYGSDHVSFLRKGMPATYLCTIRKHELDGHLEGPLLPSWANWINTKEDTIDKVDPFTLTTMHGFLVALAQSYDPSSKVRRNKHIRSLVARHSHTPSIFLLDLQDDIERR